MYVDITINKKLGTYRIGEVETKPKSCFATKTLKQINTILEKGYRAEGAKSLDNRQITHLKAIADNIDKGHTKKALGKKSLSTNLKIIIDYLFSRLIRRMTDLEAQHFYAEKIKNHQVSVLN